MKRIIIVALACMTVATSDATAQESFYKGKRLTVLINFAPGGGVDVSGRLFARYLAKHLDGQPNLIVQNMDGGAGVNGANYLGQVAAKDGTVMGYLGALPWQYVTTPERFRVDLKTYEFIAYEPITTIFFMRKDIAPGMKEAADIGKATSLISGGLGAAHSRDLIIRLTLDMLGVPYRHVTGYSSSEKSRLAMQRNEINFTGETTPGYRLAVQNLVADGLFIPVYYNPDWNGQTLSIPKQVADLPILPFQEFYRKVKGTAPSGQLWEAYLAVLALNSTMTRFFILPPGTPSAALAALQAGIRRVSDDPAFAEDAKKIIGYVPDAVMDPDTNRTVRQALLMLRPEMKEFLGEYLKKPRK